MLENLRLQNFKSIRDQQIPIGKLTVLAGLNGSGKSTVLQSLALFKQSLDASPMAEQLVLRGNLVELGRSEDVQFEGAKSDEIVIELRTSIGSVRIVSTAMPKADTLPTRCEGDISVVTNKMFDGFQFIQADRLTPAKQYLQASTPHQKSGWLGCRGEFTVDYIQRNPDMKISQRRTFPRSEGILPEGLLSQVAPTDRLLDQIAGWLQQLSPGVRPRASAVELADATSLRFEYTGTKVDSLSHQYRPTNVGFGLTYSLPIIVACLTAKPGALLLLENPEAHLHPRGQSALGLLLVRCAADGVQVIVETHSDHILNGIRIATKHGEIASDAIAIHFFSRNIENGETSIISPQLLPNGRFTEWPIGFFDEWTKALDELLDD
ncbi:DUF3696 domain-containing protein [Nitrosomonas sp.]|uniref:AAA family ATPase n=1 Tax=Nitrosomonas sp. TaxID=42353 RepID=UPI00271ABC70|nr:DUF3696 domain-containing protein [Nitrosomonas sp.]MDO8893767.1 DUF3696 domain-containing protein [Nitrosomonas sp.]